MFRSLGNAKLFGFRNRIGLSQIAIALCPVVKGVLTEPRAPKASGLPAKGAAAPHERGAPASGKRRLGYSGHCAVTRVQQDAVMHHFLARSGPILWQGGGANKAAMGVVDKLGIACISTGENSPAKRTPAHTAVEAISLWLRRIFRKFNHRCPAPKSNTNLGLGQQRK
jgi:hypothetical protein